ncbi:MAG: hypothetical protein K8I82_26630 [Anaerolineae bacterium]|nr:hypothetical protein [Anaerolineae bacterium]
MTSNFLEQLVHSLEAIPPLELGAVSLLSELRPATGEWFPTNFTPEVKTQVIAATVELVAYTQRCAAMGRRLAHLPAMPLSIPLMEFAL